MIRCRLTAAPLIMLTLLTGACSDDHNSGDADVTSACDRLEVLANDILELQQSPTDEQLAAVAEAVEGLVESARVSGDGALADHAADAEIAFEEYTTESDVDQREAGNRFDIALDRAVVACVEAGAENDFPTEPSP